MPNQERTFVIVHPETAVRKPFTGHEPKQAASKALSYLRRAKLAGKGKTVFIMKEANTEYVKKHNEKKGVRKINTDKELAYIGQIEKLKKPIKVTQGGKTRVVDRVPVLHRLEEKAAAKVKRTSHTKKRTASKKRSKFATRRK